MRSFRHLYYFQWKYYRPCTENNIPIYQRIAVKLTICDKNLNFWVCKSLEFYRKCGYFVDALSLRSNLLTIFLRATTTDIHEATFVFLIWSQTKVPGNDDLLRQKRVSNFFWNHHQFCSWLTFSTSTPDLDELHWKKLDFHDTNQTSMQIEN